VRHESHKGLERNFFIILKNIKNCGCLKLPGIEKKRYLVEDFEPFKIFLEVEVFDLPNNETKVVSRRCEGDSFEKITEKLEIGSWKKIDKNLWRTYIINFSNTIKIEAHRKYVAKKYDDGKIAILGDGYIKSKNSNSEKNVELDYESNFHPTEEQLFQITLFDETSHKDKYEEKKKKISPTMNKILILMKDNWRDMECTIDGEKVLIGEG